MNQAKLLKALLDKYEPAVGAAFRKAMANWRDSMDMAAFVRALPNNDLAAAVQALHLDPASLQPFLDSLGSAYQSSGAGTAAGFPKLRANGTGPRLVIRFNGRDPIAEAWLRKNAGDLIEDITQKQQNAIQVMLQAGLAAGDNPTATALDIVGRVGTNGKRQGGVIGLNVPQSQYLASAKAELRSKNPADLRNYLTRGLRDKRFDGYVERAIAGTPIDADTRTRMLVSYSNALLKLRGDTIALTETLPALHAAQDEAVRQVVAKGAIKVSQVTSTWRDAGDGRVRHSHVVLNGTTVPYGRPFVSPLGNKMLYPGDTSLGATAEDIVRCRCIAPLKVDFLAGVK